MISHRVLRLLRIKAVRVAFASLTDADGCPLTSAIHLMRMVWEFLESPLLYVGNNSTIGIHSLRTGLELYQVEIGSEVLSVRCHDKVAKTAFVGTSGGVCVLCGETGSVLWQVDTHAPARHIVPLIGECLWEPRRVHAEDPGNAYAWDQFQTFFAENGFQHDFAKAQWRKSDATTPEDPRSARRKHPGDIGTPYTWEVFRAFFVGQGYDMSDAHHQWARSSGIDLPATSPHTNLELNGEEPTSLGVLYAAVGSSTPGHVSPNGWELLAWDVSNGRELFRQAVGREVTALAAGMGRVYIGSVKGVLALHAWTGAKAWWAKPVWNPIECLEYADTGILYAGSCVKGAGAWSGRDCAEVCAFDGTIGQLIWVSNVFHGEWKGKGKGKIDAGPLAVTQLRYVQNEGALAVLTSNHEIQIWDATRARAFHCGRNMARCRHLEFADRGSLALKDQIALDGLRDRIVRGFTRTYQDMFEGSRCRMCRAC